MTATSQPTEKTREAGHQSSSRRKPTYSVEAFNQDHTVRIEVPGVLREDISLSLEQNILTVRAKRRALTPPGARVLHSELRPHDYELRLRLSPEVDSDRLSAALHDGILTVHLPQRATESPRQIAVR
jgi:HSP20 family protein